MPAIETARSFVNTWDCDENNHLNVQAYVGAFAVAAAQFRAAAGISADALGIRRLRHVRYHRELVVGDYIDVASHAVIGAADTAAIVHVMTERSTGELAATAIDRYAPAPGFALDARFVGEMPEAALPRGLDAAPVAVTAGTDHLLAHGGAVTHRGLILPAECDAAGALFDRHYVARFSDSAGHAWDHAGITRQWLDAHHCGRVAVEMKISFHHPPIAGDLVHIVSTVTGYSRTTFLLRHTLFDSRTDRVFAVADIVHLVMHLDTRRAVPLDAECVNVLDARVAAGRTQ